MATKQKVARPKSTENGPSSERRIRASVPTVSPADQRRAARDPQQLEYDALLPRSPNSLRSRIERILAAGGYYEPDGSEGHTVDKALLAYAATITKAVGIAMLGTPHGAVAIGVVDSELNSDEAARALMGLSALLEEGRHLSYSISIADEQAELETGGAS